MGNYCDTSKNYVDTNWEINCY